MVNYYKEAQKLAETVSIYSPFYNYKVQKRNGYTALDYFSKDDRFLDWCYIGTNKEVYIFLKGMRMQYWQNQTNLSK